MDLSDRELLIRQIHDSGRQFVLAITGGGSGAIGELLAVPGGSRSVLEAVVPYSAAALTAWIGAKPEQFCSEGTARAMAMAAFIRGQTLGANPATLCGVGCTASLASDRPKHGDHRVFVAWQSLRATVALSLTLEKGRRSRTQEESLAAALLLKAITDACGIATTSAALANPIAGLLTNEEPVQVARYEAPQPWQDLWSGRIARLVQAPSSSPSVPPVNPPAIFPGSFNPLHRGHQGMAVMAGELLGSPVAFELAVFNVDKPPLDYLEVNRRLAQFAADQTVWLTRSPTFVEKADVFPGTTFIVGADTIVRIADPKYYGGSVTARDAALAHLSAQGCNFLVFGRFIQEHGVKGRFQSLADVWLPDMLRPLCQEVPATAFRDDVCSTDLRRGKP